MRGAEPRVTLARTGVEIIDCGQILSSGRPRSDSKRGDSKRLDPFLGKTIVIAKAL